MKFQAILERLTGLSCPVFGVSWNPPEAEVSRARRILTFLEDRRVLYNPSSMELPDHCVRSVIEIRHHLTHELGQLDNNSELAKSLRAMRAACRKFLDLVQDNDRGRDIVRYGHHHGHWASWVFNGALGELRGVFGIHIAMLATEYGLDVEDELASILPAREDDLNE